MLSTPAVEGSTLLPDILDRAPALVATYLQDLLATARLTPDLARMLTLAIEHSLRPSTSPRLPLLLPLLTSTALGGSAALSVPAAGAAHLLWLAAEILDDLQDSATTPLPDLLCDRATAMNAATTLIFLAQLALLRWQPPAALSAPRSELLGSLNQMGLGMCSGQHRDLQQPRQPLVTLDEYWQMAGAKSGELLAWSCRAGAILARGTASQIAACDSYGYNIGVIAQIANDWSGLWADHRLNDLARGQRTLPMLYALSVAAPAERDWLIAALAQPCPATMAEIRARILALGGFQYLLVATEIRRNRARHALHQPPPGRLHAILHSLVSMVFPRPGGALIDDSCASA